MSEPDPFTVEGVILATRPNGTCRVELANGHQLTAYVAGRAKLRVKPPDVGVKVQVRLSPCDLSQGRLLVW